MDQSTTASSGQDDSALDDRIAELTRANGILKANISTLYRTARAEISRKNDRISELQAELDELIFKRSNKGIHNIQHQNKGKNSMSSSN